MPNNQSFFNKYIIVICLVAVAAVIAMLLINPKIVPNGTRDNASETEESIKEERQFVMVHYDTLRNLCLNYPGLGDCKVSAEPKCNISSSTTTNKKLFNPELETWKAANIANDNMISLETEIMPNGDTVVKCPVIMLFNLAKAYEEPRSAQQNF
jgi:uncharacterized GH25 family protein